MAVAGLILDAKGSVSVVDQRDEPIEPVRGGEASAGAGADDFSYPNLRNDSTCTVLLRPHVSNDCATRALTNRASSVNLRCRKRSFQNTLTTW